MSKPVYHHPSFVCSTSHSKTKYKRYWLKLTIDPVRRDTIVVIMKNPSRATKELSDKSVFNVTNYIHKNRRRFKTLSDIGHIIILNLIPLYETYSKSLKDKLFHLDDSKNFEVIKKFTQNFPEVIIAWGNSPQGLDLPYERIKSSVMKILKENRCSIFYIDKISKTGNPKHGMIWSYKDKLFPYKAR